jgi:Zn-dependent M28 family amino/carboxypeptidase
LKKRIASAALAAACALVPATAASAAAERDGSPDDPRAEAFVREVSVDRVERHQERLQEIADANAGTRVVTGGGYTDSVNYVVRVLRRAGYDAQITPFNYPVWEETALPVLNLVAPAPKTYRPGTEAQSDTPDVDFISFPSSPTVSVDDAPVVPVGRTEIPPGGAPPDASESGCAAADYPAAVRGAVALVQRGTCPFVQKWQLAQDAGAVAVVIFNEGNAPGRMNAQFVETGLQDATIPAFFASFVVGRGLYELYQAGQAPKVDLQSFGTQRDRFFDQVIAETDGGDPDHVVVVGAHLDSVEAGPGINDDGSGTALLLTMAQRLARAGHPLEHKIRFAWWGAEEEGLIGSRYYASQLSEEEADRIDVMLDYDMLSSPNFARLVYDGDGSEGDNPAGPEGSGTVEEVFREWFASKRQPVAAIPFDGRSDYVGFTLRGIPAGGVFSGAEGVKTPNQERIFGGDAGSWYDPCYHQACDDLTTVLTGVPPLDATGLAVDIPLAQRTDADRAVAAQKMRGGSRRSMRELGAAATYATWYFSSVGDPFGTGARTASIARTTASKAAKARARKAVRTHAGHVRLAR